MDYVTLISGLSIALVAATPGILAYLNTRKQVSTDANSQMITNALRIVDEYQDISNDAIRRVKDLQVEFDSYKIQTDNILKEYRDELRAQEEAIERLNARNLKLQLILSIYIHQFKIQNIEPLIHPEKWEDVTIEELRLTAESLSNLQAKRAT